MRHCFELLALLCLASFSACNLLSGLTADSTELSSPDQDASKGNDGLLRGVDYFMTANTVETKWWRVAFAAQTLVRTIFVSVSDGATAVAANDYAVTVGDNSDVCQNKACKTFTDGVSGWYTCDTAVSGLYFGVCKTADGELKFYEVMAFEDFYVSSYSGVSGNSSYQHPGTEPSNALRSEFAISQATYDSSASWNGTSGSDDATKPDYIRVVMTAQVYVTKVLVISLEGY